MSTGHGIPGSSSQAEEVRQGTRFEFGANWREFATVLDDDRIAQAERSLRDALGVDDLTGKRFLDAGSGSGLFSLAAARLGAATVHSFDFDPDSIACTRELKRRYLPFAEHWQIEPGDALDGTYLRSLGTFDVVYCWGVLHHTGAMQEAMENVAYAVAEGGRLYLALYNDQGRRSRMWREIKRIYNRLPRSLQRPYVVAVTGPRILCSALLDLVELRRTPQLGAESRRRRGMSYWHDLVDWVGGYPFEVASPGLVFDFYRERGFALEGLVTPPGWGCNQYVFTRIGA